MRICGILSKARQLARSMETRERHERKREGPSLSEYNTPSKGPRLVATSPSVLRAAGIARRYRRLRTQPSPLNDAVRQKARRRQWKAELSTLQYW